MDHTNPVVKVWQMDGSQVVNRMGRRITPAEILHHANMHGELIGAVERLNTILRGMDQYGLYADGCGKEMEALLKRARKS